MAAFLRFRFLGVVLFHALFLSLLPAAVAAPGAARVRFEVRPDPALESTNLSGRLVLVFARTNSPEPIEQVGEPSWNGPFLAGVDTLGLSQRRPAQVLDGATTFPGASLADLPPGRWWVQAVLMTNRDLRLLDAPGNLVSQPELHDVDPRRAETRKIALSRALPPESLPPDIDRVKHLRFPSPSLTAFHGRPMFLRASVVLPRTFDSEPTRRFPLVVDIGGFGSRHDRFDRALREGSKLRGELDASDTPQMILLALDGAGPSGDPYQINSDNHGPYGDALIRELIPHVEHAFRGIGQPWARFTTGGSTGGWVSFALQVLYPDFFGGCWSGFPDGVDFRAHQLVDIYRDTNAFVNVAGFERPSARTLLGDTKFTIRFEVALENVLGDGGSYANGGGQWGSWNAVYGPRGANGRALPLWDPRSGRIDPKVAETWQRYDLRLQLERNWATLGPKLHGKIHIWVGEADEYFLNNAVHLLDDFLRKTDPPAEAEIRFGPGKGHGWNPETFVERLKRMQAVVDAGAPKQTAASRDDYFRNRFLHGGTCPHCKGGR